MIQRRPLVSRRRWPRRVLATAIVAGVVLVVAGLVARDAWRSAREVGVGTPPPAQVAMTEEERAYYDHVAPRFRELAAQTRALADLGAERSRNLLAIQRGQDRVETLIDEIDAYHAAGGVPDRFIGAGRLYREGSARAREAIAEAAAGFRRFDWDRVGRATAAFETGSQTLEDAVTAMDRAVDAN